MPTARAGWTYPDLTELADGPAGFKETADEIDAEIGLPFYTSTSRPTSGNFDGRIIYETDTGRAMRYNGAGWDVLAARVWLPYTPAWTNGPGGAALSIGSGTLTGRFRQVGETVFYRVNMTRAADSNVGTTGWAFDLPVTPDAWNEPLGTGNLNRAGSMLPFTVAGVGGTTVVLVAPSGGTTGSFGTRVGASVPGSWADGDQLYFSGSYRAAAAV